MPNMFAHSAARLQSRDIRWAYGSVGLARRRSLVEHIRCRKFEGIKKAYTHSTSHLYDRDRSINIFSFSRTPAAATTRSTIRRLREIAEV